MQMRAKSRREDYKVLDLFKTDLALMKQNAEIYNGPQHPIAQTARDIEEVGLHHLNLDLVRQAQEKINQDGK